jgi:hypothetical protein
MTETIKVLNRHYYIGIVVLAVFFLLVILKPMGFGSLVRVTMTAEMYAIGITLLAIPVALKLFAEKIKKIPKGTGKNSTMKRYKNSWLLRMYIVNAVTAGNVFLFAFSQNRNFMWLALISFLVYMFCKPSCQELETIVRKSEDVK